MENEKEIWKQFRDCNYEASSLGNIRNKKTGRVLNQRKMKNGYLLVDIQIDKKNITFRSNRLIAETFLGVPEEDWQADHINRVRDDNRIKNLRWTTPTENNNNRGRFDREIIKFIVEAHDEGKTLEDIYRMLHE